MTLRVFSLQERIEKLDRLIGDLRQVVAGTRTRQFVPTSETLGVLKAIAAEQRGRAPESVNAALNELGRRIEDLLKSKATDGTFPRDALVGLGQELVGRWPSVRQALEEFEEAMR